VAAGPAPSVHRPVELLMKVLPVRRVGRVDHGVGGRMPAGRPRRRRQQADPAAIIVQRARTGVGEQSFEARVVTTLRNHSAIAEPMRLLASNPSR